MTPTFQTLEALHLADKPLSNGELRHQVGTSKTASQYRRLVLQIMLDDSHIIEEDKMFSLTPQGRALYLQMKEDKPYRKVATPTKKVDNGVPRWQTPVRPGALNFLNVPSRGYPT